jgi:hypothetical protein
MKPKFPAWIYTVIVVMGIYCSERKPFVDGTVVAPAPKTTQIAKPGSHYNDTILVHSNSAVFYSPDSIQLQEIKSFNDSRVFEGIMHECFYQQRNARNVLKMEYPGIKIVEVKNARYLLFRKESKETEVIDLNRQNDPCGLFLFDPARSPKLADMMNIESELGFYFSKNRHKLQKNG